MLQNIIYKTDRIMSEFIGCIDPRLQAFLLWMSYHVDHKYGKNLTLTCLNRTLEENKEVNGAQYSAHLVGRAADIRSWHFTQAQIEEIIKKVNEVWGDMIYILYHNSGSGDHIHANITKKYHIKNYC